MSAPTTNDQLTAAPTPSTTASLTVVRTTREAENINSLVLADPAGGKLAAWTPGAHVNIILETGVTRQYSLCGDPADDMNWRIAVLREEQSRGGSAYLHDKIRAGSSLTVGSPRNNFPLVGARRYILIAGGIGITPLLPMITELEGRDAEWTLFYGGRQRSSMAFLTELSAYPDQVFIHPQDESGLLPLGHILARPEIGTAVYCCGPEALLTAVEAACGNWPSGAVHVERFRPRERPADSPADTAFDVVIGSTGQRIRVGADRTILQALERAGFDVPSSCREGTCGNCETRFTTGEVDHRDEVLTIEEQRTGNAMMICVSRARTDSLILDI
ncbi:PDR/VanB family oxidoreductase [Frankia sp. Cas3]|uniref:PDR/VanB family oxidoreductase n=1 Tax=Frankia sp. Cas3 TaxID=3073926 RepID=UPI002AD33B3B|nr:PDR/VanB family oxidoreductase [Frankia sp. Cas3]